jgi:hypothetical protein
MSRALCVSAASPLAAALADNEAMAQRLAEQLVHREGAHGQPDYRGRALLGQILTRVRELRAQTAGVSA